MTPFTSALISFMTFMASMMQTTVSGLTSAPISMYGAAVACLFGAMLAQRGMTGPSPIFEGAGGYFKAVTRAPFALPALGGRAHPYKIMECSIKRYPLGQYSQTVVQAALEAGLLINVTADRVIRLLPPLVMRQEDAQQLVDTLVPLVARFLGNEQKNG